MYNWRKAPDQIIDKLYLGNMSNAGDLESLQSLKISHILIVADFLRVNFPDNFTYLKISIDDSPSENIKQHFKETNKFIKEGLENGTGILVHW
jgi:hypothetical protein